MPQIAKRKWTRSNSLWSRFGISLRATDRGENHEGDPARRGADFDVLRATDSWLVFFFVIES